MLFQFARTDGLKMNRLSAINWFNHSSFSPHARWGLVPVRSRRM